MRSYRRAPRPLTDAMGALQKALAPATVLARVQALWPEAVGTVIAAEAVPSAERSGVLTVTCSASVWAQELDLMGPAILERLNARLEGRPLTRLRCIAA